MFLFNSNFFSITLSVIFFSVTCNASSFLDVSYDDIRKSGGFNSSYLSNVCRIRASNPPLSEAEKEALIHSEYLGKVHTIDLSNQDLDNDFIKKLSENKSLKRIINLDISNNPRIDRESVDYILKSPILGSTRDLPQISGRYGFPSTTIYLTANNTGIVSSDSSSNMRYGFHIEYKHPIFETDNDSPVDDAIKFVDCCG